MSLSTEPNRRAMPGGREPVVVNQRKPLIMNVDDDLQCRRFAKDVIERAGYGFVGASSGSECLTLLHLVYPRIILLDIMMPEMDGYETCRRVRLNFPMVRSRIIYLSALNSLEDISRALGTDADDYVVKPFDPARLRERIQHWLREGPRPTDL
jgi:DNA-binding response OmpR family regulator